MKKSFKKLQLSRETLGSLDQLGLKNIVGGSGSATSFCCLQATGCDCETENGCYGETWEHTCTVLCCSTMAHC